MYRILKKKEKKRVQSGKWYKRISETPELCEGHPQQLERVGHHSEATKRSPATLEGASGKSGHVIHVSHILHTSGLFTFKNILKDIVNTKARQIIT